MDKLYNVGEIAELLNVTKQCIYKKINSLENVKQHLTIKNKTKYLTNEGISILKQNIKPNTESSILNVEHRLKSYYEKQIENLKEIIIKNNDDHERILQLLQNQLITKDKHLENMQVLLKNEQDKNKLLLTSAEKKWWQFWK